MPENVVRVELALWKKLVYSGFLVAVVLVWLEVLLRLLGLGQDPAGLPPGAIDPLTYFAISDPYLGFKNRPNGANRTSYIEGEPLCTTDEFGYRNGFGWPGDEDSPIVLFVGDSITFCAEVPDDQTLPSEVAKLLSEEFDVRVLNAGVRGYGTLQAKRTMLRCFERFPRIKVVVYTFCGNDLVENVVPGIRFPCNSPCLVRNEQTGRFEEAEVSDPTVPWEESILNWTPPPPPEPDTRESVIQWFEDRSVLFRRCLRGWHEIAPPPDPPSALSQGESVPRAENPACYRWALDHGTMEALQQLLAEMDEVCRSHGAVFLATSTYTGIESVTCEAFDEVCEAADVRVVSLLDAFTEGPSAYTSTSRRIDGRQDTHYGPLGTKTYARAVAPALKEILRSQVEGKE